MIKEMTLKKFVELGLLQEVNRQMLHPMGLALGIIQHENGDVEFDCVWDYSDDPEGMIFSDEVVNGGEFESKAQSAKEMFEAKRNTREKNLGFHIQPVRADDK